MNAELPVVNQAPAVKPDNRKFIIIVSVIAAVLLIIIVIIVATSTNNETVDSQLKNNLTSMPANTCPDKLVTEGKISAEYKGQSFNLSQTEYNWILTNCNSSETPELENLGILFGDYNASTGKAGSFIFDKVALATNSQVQKPLIEFGYKVTNDGKTKILPEITYTQVDTNTDVLAMADGRVVEVTNQGSDYAVGILFNDEWVALYDHVINLNVSLNDMVKANDVIGKVALNKDGLTGFTEIAVKKVSSNNVSEYYCPVDLLSSNIKQAYIANIKTLMQDWRAYSGDNSIYVDSQQTTPGCLLTTIIE